MLKINRKRMIGLLVLFSLTVLFFTNLGLAQGKSYQVTLSFSEYFSVSSGRTMDETGSIDWSFSGSNIVVGINVWILDETNFALFEADNPSAVGYEQSDGSYYSDSGSWNVQALDTWWIVFLHDQLIGGSTTLTIEVDFIGGGLVGWLIAIIIIAPIVVVGGLIGLVIFLVVRSKKKPPAPTPTHAAAQQPTAPPPPQPSPPAGSVFCWSCGTPNTQGSRFCMKCGSDMAKPE